MTTLVNDRTHIQDPTMKVEAPSQLLRALAQSYDTLERVNRLMESLVHRVTGLAQGASSSQVPMNVIGFARRNLDISIQVHDLAMMLDEAIGDAPESEGSAMDYLTEVVLDFRSGTQTVIEPKGVRRRGSAIVAPDAYLISRIAKRFEVDPEYVGVYRVLASEVSVGDVLVYHDEAVVVNSTFSTKVGEVEGHTVTFTFDMGATATFNSDEPVTRVMGVDNVINASLDDIVTD